MSNVCNIEFLYNNKFLSFSLSELENFFVEDEEFYRAIGNAFDCFRATISTRAGRVCIAAFKSSFDAQLLRQISKLTIDQSDLGNRMTDLFNLFVKERQHNYPANLLITLQAKNETICASQNDLLQKISIPPFKDCATFELVSIARTSSSGGFQAFSASNILKLNGDTGVSCKVDRIALTQLENIKMHFGGFNEWVKTVKKITDETQQRISKSTSAEKHSIPSSTPPKLPKKQQLNK